MAKILEIRNSTAEFLTFLAANQEEGVQVVYCDETIWATQADMGELFGVEAKTIGFHLQNIYQEGELIQDRTTQKIGVVQLEGTRSVNREPMFYNLDAIISVGYRVSSIRATQFRQWCPSKVIYPHYPLTNTPRSNLSCTTIRKKQFAKNAISFFNLHEQQYPAA